MHILPQITSVFPNRPRGQAHTPQADLQCGLEPGPLKSTPSKQENAQELLSLLMPPEALPSGLDVRRPVLPTGRGRNRRHWMAETL